jgi:hypothetical protein
MLRFQSMLSVSAGLGTALCGVVVCGLMMTMPLALADDDEAAGNQWTMGGDHAKILFPM